MWRGACGEHVLYEAEGSVSILGPLLYQMIDEKFAELPVRLLLHAHLANNQNKKINFIFSLKRYNTYFTFVFIIKTKT
jgi:hypothetical protein